MTSDGSSQLDRACNYFVTLSTLRFNLSRPKSNRQPRAGSGRQIAAGWRCASICTAMAGGDALGVKQGARGLEGALDSCGG